jgi:glycosyltransferase involved in cell wall biosynthesis
LTSHCKASHGGIWYDSFKEWAAALSIADEETKRTLGRQGQAYVRQNYSWDQVERTYLQVLASFQEQSTARTGAALRGS